MLILQHFSTKVNHFGEILQENILNSQNNCTKRYLFPIIDGVAEGVTEAARSSGKTTKSR
jgi:hypothetical protein